MPALVRPGDDGDLLQGRVFRQRRLDLARLDAEAADLDLLVHPAEELELPVGPPAGAVAGPIHPPAVERVGDEPPGRQFRPI